MNDTSLRIGDYESLKEAAIDPYVAIRDAYVQYRLKQVSRKGGSVPKEDSGSPKKCIRRPVGAARLSAG